MTSRISILLLSLLWPVLTPVIAQACPTGVPGSLAYIRRDNNRCEGLRDSRPVAGVPGLMSLTTGTPPNYPPALLLRVPGSDRPPTVEMQSYSRNYRLDQLRMRPTTQGFTFSLDTSENSVLQRSGVPPSSLRAVAYVEQDSERLYYPVILGNSSGRYEFVVYSPDRRRFPVFEIRRNGTTILSRPRNQPTSGAISLVWQAKDSPAGTYELYLVDDQQQTRRFRFVHNPGWL